MFTHVLLDCDNTLVLSEALAFSACSTVLNEALATHGVAAQLSGDELMRRFVGRSFRGILRSLADEHRFDLLPDVLEALALEEQRRVTALLATDVTACAGVLPALETLARDHVLAVVSSSALARVKVCLERTGQAGFFGDRVYSAEGLAAGKPDPAVYRFALERLGVAAEACVAVEDSASGVRAAIAAGIACVGYVGALPDAAERAARAEELGASGARRIFEDWAALPAW